MGFFSKIGKKLKSFGKKVLKIGAPFIPVVGQTVSGLIAERDARKAQKAADAQAAAEQAAFLQAQRQASAAAPPATQAAGFGSFFGSLNPGMILVLGAVLLLVLRGRR